MGNKGKVGYDNDPKTLKEEKLELENPKDNLYATVEHAQAQDERMNEALEENKNLDVKIKKE